MELGRIGVWVSPRAVGTEQFGAAAELAEDLGYGAFWLGGSPRLPVVRPLLDATSKIVVGTSIVNIWAYEPADLAAEYAELAPDFSERLLVGIGVGHPEATGTMPCCSRPCGSSSTASMRPNRASPATAGPSRHSHRRCPASAERSLGALPYFVQVAHTRAARALLGPDVLLAPEVACVLDEDPERARATAREFARIYLGLSNYTNNLIGTASRKQDIADGGSDRLIDAVIPHGTAEISRRWSTSISTPARIMSRCRSRRARDPASGLDDHGRAPPAVANPPCGRYH